MATLVGNVAWFVEGVEKASHHIMLHDMVSVAEFKMSPIYIVIESNTSLPLRPCIA